MKLIKIILIILLAVSISGTCGFISPTKAPYTQPDLMPAPANAPSGAVDFSVSNADLSVFPDIAEPGDPVYFKVRVHNNSVNTGSCGGSVVRFIMNGKVIDEMPFYLDSGQSYKDISARIFLPEGDYSNLAEREQVSAQIQAIVDPYNKTAESNENNNSASFQFTVRGIHPVILEGINPGITVDVSGLSAWSVKNDAPGDKINAALPGQKLHLKARLNFTGDATSDDINAKFILNDTVIKDFNRQITNLPASGYIDLNAEYYVPVNASQPLDFTVVLNNGYQARINIPVIRYDIGISASDLHWSGETVAVPGKNLTLKAAIKNVTMLQFPFDFNKIAYRVLIDEAVFYEDDLYLFNDVIYPSIPAYKVPAGRTAPIQYTIILDPYNQIIEGDESNNTATINIPVQNTGSAGPDFSVSAEGLSYASKPILAGSQVKLSAAILNNSKTHPSKDLRVLFKINGVTISDFKVNKSFLNPLQYYIATKDWTVPSDLPAGSVFEVVLDPAGEFAGEDTSDNMASIILDMYSADLEITTDCLTWSPQEPGAGQEITLFAAIRNNGIIPVVNCIVKFMLDGISIWQSNDILVPGVSGAVSSFKWWAPTADELALDSWGILKGETGKLSLPSGTTKDYKFSAEADPQNNIAESNEANNISGEKTISINVPYNKGIVYVRVYDKIGNILGAEVELKTAGGATATSSSAGNGWCTFTGVPFDSYTITIKKQEYEDLIFNSSIIEGRVSNNNELELTRKSQYSYFSATTSTLEGITALKVDFSCQLLDNRIENSGLIFEWRNGQNIISESSSFTHYFVQARTHEVTLTVKNADYETVFTKSFNIKVNPPVLTFSDEGRKITSLGSIFVDAKYDINDGSDISGDGDGINQTWENIAMVKANPYFELDEGENWLEEQYKSGHRVANFVRITPYPSTLNPNTGLPEYILFYYAVAWTKDYGRYFDFESPSWLINLFEAHNGDVEKVILAWKVIDDKNLELKYVYTSAHGGAATNHSAVWDAKVETTNTGFVKFWFDDKMKATLEYHNNALKLYPAEDKHALYPTQSVGESVKLVFLMIPTTIPLVWVPWFVREDVGGGPIMRFDCHNAGEENVPLIDDISDIFPNERIWSGNTSHEGNFCGGLEWTENCPGKIGDSLKIDPEGKLEQKLNEVLAKQNQG